MGTLDTYYATHRLPQYYFYFNNNIYYFNNHPSCDVRIIQTSVLFKVNVYRINRYAVLQIVNYDLSKQNVYNYNHVLLYFLVFQIMLGHT